MATIEMPHGDSGSEELSTRTTSSGYDENVPTAHGSEALLSKPVGIQQSDLFARLDSPLKEPLVRHGTEVPRPKPNMREQLERDVDRR